MPITLAHPIAVLPFARYLPVPALVAGAIAPDVVYYLPLPLDGSATHSPLGLLSWNLLLGLALLAAFRLSAPPALALSPYRVSRSTPAPPRPGGQPMATILALAVGAMTHLLWDSATQTAGFAVRHWELLRAPVLEPHRVYNVIGYLSSLVGTAVVAVLLVRNAHRHTPGMARPWRRVILTVLVAAPVLGAVLAVDDPVTRTSGYDLVRHVIVGAAQGLGCAWTVYALGWWITDRWSPGRAAATEGEGDRDGERRDDSGRGEGGGHAADQGVGG